jgi:hypothetical protein
VTGWADRLAIGHVATASVIGGTGSTGGLGSWWLPITVASATLAVVAAAVALQSRRRGAGLSRLARALDPREWEQTRATAA